MGELGSWSDAEAEDSASGSALEDHCHLTRQQKELANEANPSDWHKDKSLMEQAFGGEIKLVAKTALENYNAHVVEYSWIANQRDAHETLICQQTRRVTTIPRPRMKSSWRGEFRSSGFHFL